MALKDTLLKIVKNPGVRHAVSALLGALLAALGMSLSGCASMPPAQAARVEVLACRVAALAPLVDGVLDAEALVKDVYEGRASIGSVLAHLNATQAEVDALVKAFAECDGPQVPAGEAS